MPWMEGSIVDEKNASILFYHLAKLHKKTKQEINIPLVQLENVYQQIQNKWKRNFNLLEAFMEQIEKKWYMSPFELAVFSYYFETRQAILFAEAKLDEWYNEIKQSPHMRIALNKVNVSLSHFLLDPKGKIYFINMEDAAFATPIYDLFLMFMNLSEAEPTVSDQNVQYISDYEKVLPLTKTERLLLVSYLSYPAKLVKLVRQYQKKKSEKGELEYCKQLLRAYWQMKNTGYIALKWNEKLENDSLASE
jgi:spore coat protein YsxE